MMDAVDDGGSRSEGLRLDELARELPGAAEIAGDAAVHVRGVRHDSRAVVPGDLFVARRGERTDGSHFVGDAVSRGASAVMAARGTLDRAGVPVPVPVLYVDDPASALAYAASAVYGHPSFSLEVVGITGTNGKTTTAHLLRAAVDGALGRACCGVLGTVGHFFGAWRAPAEHTTPEADDIARAMAQMQARGATHAAMEVSSHALELGRVRAIRFRVAALTNLTQDHLDFHGSMESYAAAKARLFTELGPGSAVLNVDDPFGRELLKRTRAPVIRVSARPGTDGDVVVRNARADARGIEAAVRTPHGDVRIASRLIGAHNLENLVLALGMACALELDPWRAADGLSREGGAPGRLERCDTAADDVTVLVDYAHTPDALARVLDAVRKVSAGRVLCVFGCGGDRDPTKRGPMGEAVARRADVAIVTNDNPRTEDPRAIADAVIAGVRAGGREPIVELDRRKAIELAVRSASEGDLVVIAGKGHEDYQVVGTVKHPFDDRTEARRALAERRDRRGGA
jgi:UDP-N-acetylmuramoyl-L-alanyl-D-glutamate--2,6-diaminopimelate ligase